MSVEALRRHSPPQPAHHPAPPRTDAPRSGVRPIAIATTGTSRSLAARATRTGRIVGPGATERRVARRLNEFMQKMGGPYQIGDKQVFVAPAFRMNGGMNQKTPDVYSARIARALPPSRFRELAPIVGTVVTGKGTPDDVRRLTQALIDTSAFESYKSMPPKQAVRELMWHFGIGMDCSGYVHRAFLYSRGSGPDDSAPASRYALGNALASNIQHLPNGAFKRVSPADARAGDIVVLTNGPDGTGHKLIVYDRDRLAPGSAMHRVVERGLGSSKTARIDLYRVDSSWGAGGKPMQGGVKRALWAYDEGSGKWATLIKGDNGHYYAFASHRPGPYDHDLQGIYRPKAEN